jgi:hypothetical protein
VISGREILMYQSLCTAAVASGHVLRKFKLTMKLYSTKMELYSFIVELYKPVNPAVIAAAARLLNANHPPDTLLN